MTDKAISQDEVTDEAMYAPKAITIVKKVIKMRARGMNERHANIILEMMPNYDLENLLFLM